MLKYKLSQEIAVHQPEYATMLDQLLQLEVARYGEVRGHSDYFPASPVDLTLDHFFRGHFTEVIDAIDRLFACYPESQEAVYRLLGVYHSKRAYTTAEFQEVLAKVKSGG
jgi:hypothetical protein